MQKEQTQIEDAFMKAQTTDNLTTMETETKEKLNRLNMELKKAEERVDRIKKRMRQESRTRDTRKKIIVGAAFLKAMERDRDFRIMAWEAVESCISEKDRAYLAGLK